MTEKHRPLLHFSPAKGWINDPNGLIRIDGSWHLFYQHNPNGIDHADMHWGHAVSRDLVVWEEQPVALAPDALGACFSGSAIETASGEVKLFYTAHSVDDLGQDYQTQCLVHADRALTRFDRDPANPVLPNPGLSVFRDPKVLWHAPTGRWIMLVTLGQEIGFYSSTDLTAWAFESRFGESDIVFRGGVWECPDLIPFGEEWALIVGLQSGAFAAGSGTGYLIGNFDGHRFTTRTEMLWLDHGRDFYAAQSFFDRSGGLPTVMAWASNWDYARRTPAEGFRGVMSLPRILSLVETPDGPRLCQTVPPALIDRFAVAPAGTAVLSPRIDLAPGEAAALHLFAEDVPQFHITRQGKTATLRCHRAGTIPGFGHDVEVTLPWPAHGLLALTLFVDRGLVELSAADGLIWVTTLFYPEHPEAPARIETHPIPKETAHG